MIILLKNVCRVGIIYVIIINKISMKKDYIAKQ